MDLNTLVWIVQILLALMFAMVGIMKILRPSEELKERYPYVEDFSGNTINLIGVVEIAAAIGLILPMALNILPWLTPLAAAGLVILMLGAMFTHIRRGEYPNTIVNVVLLALSLFVIYGRVIAEPVV